MGQANGISESSIPNGANNLCLAIVNNGGNEGGNGNNAINGANQQSQSQLVVSQMLSPAQLQNDSQMQLQPNQA